MKKIFIATLITTMFGIAQAQTTISGKLSEYQDNTIVNGIRTSKMVTEPTSNITFTATENLGRGLSANVTLDTSLGNNTIDNGSTTKLGDRQGTVGLSNKYATVQFGRNVHTAFTSISDNDVFNTLYGSVAGDVHNLRNLRFTDAAYVTVTPLKNLSLTYERTNQNLVANNATVIAAAGSLYKVNVNVARFEQGNEKTTVVGANTTLYSTKVAYVHSEDEGAVNSKSDSIGVAKDFGPLTVKTSYGVSTLDTHAYNVGADYNLSKRTSLSAVYRNVNRKGVVADTEQFGVGLTHKF